ncbi:uncharacterized mitochondrial protein AtMg00810-like [Quercus suber]|uniref:uncharacterized mitochondrial protein AtMg00810-like n=1 Tax=Quercus suber TaxID=58331 RepID=UPI0032DF4DF1
MAPISAQSKSLGRTFTMSTNDLKNIIANVIRMVGNTFYSSSLSALSDMSPSSWLMDSACCNHMTPRSSLFSGLKLALQPLNICTANGSTMSGHNIGSVLTSNISVPGDLRMGQELGTGPKFGRMFPVDNLRLLLIAHISIVTTATVSSISSLALWHARLGHASSSRVSQYLSTPRSTHYAAILRILRYLKGTLFHGLFYSAQSPLILCVFSDADWVGDPTDCRSTTGY